MVAKTFSKRRNKTKIRSVFYANDSRYFGCVNPKLGTPPIAKQKLPGAVAVAVAVAVTVTDDVTGVGTGAGALLLEGSWWALLTKLVDLIETGIFVLRKKNRQISFLHLYHHVSTVLLGWMFGKYYADGMGTFIPLVNCTVHVIMYTYYFLSTFGPNVRKVIHRYKFLLTITQMVSARQINKFFVKTKLTIIGCLNV
uniref:Elongation of very long chain fatty acids protein n=1 Tax=Vespula pensylvanica TaxID=30213 RepID=A0A834PEP7_VESPE|nr:hypothetical protein H0235_000147 [Vespula pensylvanica]